MVQKIFVNQKDRVETGVVEFQYSDGRVDWPSLNIRGDDCFHYRLSLERVLKHLEMIGVNDGELRLSVIALKGLYDDLKSSDIREIEKNEQYS